MKVDSIWLSPIYESEGEFGNVDFIIDHGKIDSRFGTEDDFKELLIQVKNRGKYYKYYQESIAGSVIQGTGIEEFEDGFRTGVLTGGCWCPCGGHTYLRINFKKPLGMRVGLGWVCWS